MLAPLPLTRALGAGLRLHDAPAAAPRVLCACLRPALQVQRQPIARRYATVHDPFSRDRTSPGPNADSGSQWGSFEKQATAESDEREREERAFRLEENARAEEENAHFDYIRYISSYGREIERLRRLLSRKGRRRFPPEADLVGWLLEAIRAGDPWRAYVFLINATSEGNLTRLVELPAAQFAELLECLDPLKVHSRVDLLAGERCSAPGVASNFRYYLINKYGVRRIYGSVLDVLGPVVEARVLDIQAVTPPAVFTTLLRLAGAASLPRLAYRIRELAAQAMSMWSGARRDPSGSATFMLDFLRTLFLTEPLYFQYDKARVRTQPRNMPLSVTKLRSGQRKALQELMLGVRETKFDFYGIDPECEYDNMQRFTGNHVRMRDALSLPKIYAMRPSEDLICEALKVSTVSGMTLYLRKILYAFYGIQSREDPGTGEISFYGGYDAAPPGRAHDKALMTPSEKVLVKPSGKVLMAIVRALGTSGEIGMAMRLTLFMASRYDISVPPEVWAEYIEYAATHGSRPATLEWELAGDPRMIRSFNEVPAAMAALEAQDVGYVPTMSNLTTLAGNQIYFHRVTDALGQIREMRARLGELEAQVERAAVAAAAAEAQGVPMPSYPSRDMAFHQLVTRRDLLQRGISNTARLWLRNAGQGVRGYKDGVDGLPVVESMIPDFVREFADILPGSVEYDTHTGTILLRTGVKHQLSFSKKLARGPDSKAVHDLKVLLDPEDDPENYADLWGGDEGVEGETEAERMERMERQDAESERAEAERMEAESVEAERLEAEKLEAERLEAKRAEADRLERQRAEAVRLEAQGADETTSFERLLARATGAQRNIESLIAQNMGGDRPGAPRATNTNTTDRKPPDRHAEHPDPGPDAAQHPDASPFRRLDTLAAKSADFNVRQNEGRGTIWDWEHETVIVRRFAVTNTVRAVWQRDLAPMGAPRFDLGRRAVFVQGGRVFLGEGEGRVQRWDPRERLGEGGERAWDDQDDF